jgi:hypothetical protein
MMTDITLTKTVYTKDNSGIINTQFSQLLNSSSGSQNTDLNIDDFFTTYESIFYQIPTDGDNESHTYILNKEANYLGIQLSNDINVTALLDEITSLRQELLDAQTTINNLSITNS